MLNLIVAEIQDSKYLPLPLISFVCRVTSHKSQITAFLYTLHFTLYTRPKGLP